MVVQLEFVAVSGQERVVLGDVHVGQSVVQRVRIAAAFSALMDVSRLLLLMLILAARMVVSPELVAVLGQKREVLGDVDRVAVFDEGCRPRGRMDGPKKDGKYCKMIS